jgi:hypothetical protein
MLLSIKDNRSQLPKKEQIVPNQLSWPPTATCIGVKCREKRCHSKVNSALMAEHISTPKCKHTNDNPYGAGEHSKKCAKPDAVSTAANAQVWAQAAAAEHPLPASLPMRLPPSSVPYTQMLPIPMHGPVIYSPSGHFPVPPVPYSQPTHFQYPTSQPVYLPIYSPYTYLPYTFPPPA